MVLNAQLHAGFLLTCLFAGSSRLPEEDSERTVLVTNVNSKKNFFFFFFFGETKENFLIPLITIK